jgi:hypothetical protein
MLCGEVECDELYLVAGQKDRLRKCAKPAERLVVADLKVREDVEL